MLYVSCGCYALVFLYLNIFYYAYMRVQDDYHVRAVCVCLCALIAYTFFFRFVVFRPRQQDKYTTVCRRRS